MTRSPTKRGARRSDAAAKPRILLVGDDERLAPLRVALAALEATLAAARWSPALAVELDRSTAGVIFVPPLAGTRLWRAVQALREAPWGSRGVVLVVLHEQVADRQVRELYAAGVSAVLEQRRDAGLLADLVAQALGIEQAWGKADHADVALARAVRARLKLSASAPDALHIRCHEGVVQLAGPLEYLSQRAAIAELVERVPGVRSVVAHDLRVEPSGMPDREVLRQVRQLLRALPSAAHEVISTAVDAGTVTLAGSVPSTRALEDIARAVADVRGVRELQNLIVVSPAQHDSDRAAVRRLQGLLAQLFPQQPVEVEAFGGVRVLRGAVPDLPTKRRIASIVRDDPGTERVIDRLAVR